MVWTVKLCLTNSLHSIYPLIALGTDCLLIVGKTSNFPNTWLTHRLYSAALFDEVIVYRSHILNIEQRNFLSWNIRYFLKKRLMIPGPRAGSTVVDLNRLKSLTDFSSFVLSIFWPQPCVYDAPEGGIDKVQVPWGIFLNWHKSLSLAHGCRLIDLIIWNIL